MNDRDSEALAGLFLESGYSLAESPEDADVILVNTCSVREHAENRAISFLGALKKQSTVHSPQTTERKGKTMDSSQRRKPVVGLIGCMARNRGEELFKKMPHIDLVVGPAGVDKIPEYVEAICNRAPEHQSTRAPEHHVWKREHQSTSRRIIDLEDRLRDEDFYHASFRIEKDHAQVVISTGCSNYCSYCVVPYVRGPLRLRKPEDIIDEVKRNVSLGIKKITLLGQNVNDYNFVMRNAYRVTRNKKERLKRNTHDTIRSTSISFVDLLKMVEEVEGVEEIDFITSHPKNTTKELFELMASSKKIKKHLHLPFQSGSDRILRLMNRGYSKKGYLNLVKAYKSIVGGTLSTDVIVGFPTETKENFLETKDILEKVRFNYAYIFKYSPRPNTQANKLKDDVVLEEKERRHKILLALQKTISLELNPKLNLNESYKS